MRKSSSRRQRAGFTLMEVLLVLAILVVLGSLVIVNFTNIMGDADAKSARIQIGAMETAVDAYYLHIKKYPTNLEALMTQPSDIPNPAKWKGPYLDKAIPNDPWSQPYQYSYPGKHNTGGVDIWSLGPDGADGTDDDIGNWMTE